MGAMGSRESPGRKRNFSTECNRKGLNEALCVAGVMTMAPVSDVIVPKTEFSVSIVRQEKIITFTTLMTTARILG